MNFNNILWISFGRLGVQFLSLSVFFFSAKFLSTQDYGMFSLIMSILIFSELLSRECIENFIIPRGLLSKKIYIPIFLATIALATLSSLIIFFISSEISPLSQATFFVYLIILFHASSSIVRGSFLYLQKVKHLAAIQILSSIFSSLVAIYLLINDYGYTSLIIQQIIIWGGVSICGIIILSRLKISTISVNTKEWMTHCRSGCVSAFLTVVNNRLDIFVISILFSHHELGLYSFTKRIYQIVQDILVGGLERYLIQFQANKTLKEIYYSSAKMKVATSIFATLTATMIAALSPTLLTFLFSDKWQESYSLFYLMSGAFVFSFLLSIERSSLYAVKRMDLLVHSKLYEFFSTALFVLFLGRLSYEHMGIANSIRLLTTFILIHFFITSQSIGTRNKLPIFLFIILPGFACFALLLLINTLSTNLNNHYLVSCIIFLYCILFVLWRTFRSIFKY